MPDWLRETWEKIKERKLLNGVWSVVRTILLALLSLGAVPIYFQFFKAFDPTVDVGTFRWRTNPSNGSAVLILPVRFTNLGAQAGSITDVVARVKISSAADDRSANLLLSPVASLKGDYSANRVGQEFVDSMESVFSPISLSKQETAERLLFLEAWQGTAKLPDKELMAGEWETEVLYRGEGFGIVGQRTTLDWQSAVKLTGGFDERDIDRLRNGEELVEIRFLGRELLGPIP